MKLCAHTSVRSGI